MQLIDLEAHFYTEDFLTCLRSRRDPPRQLITREGRRSYWEPSRPGFYLDHSAGLEETLLDVGEGRIAAMDAAGVQAQVLSLTTPSVEQFESEVGVTQARAVNDELATAIARYPERLIGLATLPAQEPDAAADELERCVRKLGFRGANLMSHAGDRYLDAPEVWPIFEAAERLGVLVSLHPTLPHGRMLDPYVGYGWALPGPGLGFGAETAVQAMRLIYSGLFDRYPKLQVMLGHFGEGLSFWAYRLDFDVLKPWLSTGHPYRLERRPSEYLKQNFHFNSSANFIDSALMSCLLEFGSDRIMFASDYPWETFDDAVAFLERAPLSDQDRESIARRNAVALLGLPTAESGAREPGRAG